MPTAMQKLKAAQAKTGSLLSIGLEPTPDYLFHGLTASVAGYKAYLRTIISATSDYACAYKMNLAFFEALPGGWDLMFEVRDFIPSHSILIADAKRGDIGNTAKRYALSIFDQLKADSVTVNPLMGFDSVEPFLEYKNKLTFLLCLTSNPGADDFLLPEQLYRRIALKAQEWGEHENVGLVVGATRPEYLSEIRALTPSLPFLIPGFGAQGGKLQETLENGKIANDDFSGMILHVTRGILPTADEKGDPRQIIEEKTKHLCERIQEIRRIKSEG